jgi:hypothetical protein
MLAAEEGKKSGSGLEQAPRSPAPPSSRAIGRELGLQEAPNFMEEDETRASLSRADADAGQLECWRYGVHMLSWSEASGQ